MPNSIVLGLTKKIGIKSVGFDHVRSVENDVFKVPKNIRSTFGLPPKKEEAENEKHTRANDVQLDVDEIEKVNATLKKTGYLDYLLCEDLKLNIQY